MNRSHQSASSNGRRRRNTAVMPGGVVDSKPLMKPYVPKIQTRYQANGSDRVGSKNQKHGSRNGAGRKTVPTPDLARFQTASGSKCRLKTQKEHTMTTHHVEVEECHQTVRGAKSRQPSRFGFGSAGESVGACRIQRRGQVHHYEADTPG